MPLPASESPKTKEIPHSTTSFSATPKSPTPSFPLKWKDSTSSQLTKTSSEPMSNSSGPKNANFTSAKNSPQSATSIATSSSIARRPSTSSLLTRSSRRIPSSSPSNANSSPSKA